MVDRRIGELAVPRSKCPCLPDTDCGNYFCRREEVFSVVPLDAAGEPVGVERTYEWDSRVGGLVLVKETARGR